MDKNKLHAFRNFIIPPRINYDIEEIEKALKNLNDILFVKIILSEEKDIREIHVITKDSSNPKKIIRDIESFLLAKYNVQVDYRKISIAQIKSEEMKGTQSQAELESASRLKFSDLKVVTTGNHYEVFVQLECNGEKYEGKVSGINWKQNQEYLVAKATLEGISSFVEGSIFFQVDEIKKIELDKKEVVVVSIYLINPKRKENLIGSAVIEEDYNKAVIKAILKATNRRIIVAEKE